AEVEGRGLTDSQGDSLRTGLAVDADVDTVGARRQAGEVEATAGAGLDTAGQAGGDVGGGNLRLRGGGGVGHHLAAEGGAGGLRQRGYRDQHAAGQRTGEQAEFEPARRETGLAVHGGPLPGRALVVETGDRRKAFFSTPAANGIDRPAHPLSIGVRLDCRTTSCGSSSSGTASAVASGAASSRRRIARAPSSAISTRIVVSGGCT